MELAKSREQQIMLSTEVFNQVSEVLRDLVASTRADFSIFCDANGHPITHAGKAGQVNLSALSALAAGDFAATMEIARLIGERDGFKFLFQEGENRNIYLCNVGFNFLLGVIFERAVALGLIRIFANKSVDRLRQILDKAAQAENKASEFLDVEFGALLGKEFDRTFKL